MNKRVTENNVSPRLLNTDELMVYSGLGRNRSVELGDIAGARIRIGKRVLWDRQKLDKYFDSLTGGNDAKRKQK